LAVIDAQNATQLQPLRRLGDGLSTGAIAYSADGRLLAVATTAVIYVYDANTLDELNILEHGQTVEYLAFSRDGQRLAAATDDGVTVWTLDSETVIAHWTGAEDNGRVTAFSPDLEMAVFTASTSGATLRQVNDGTPLVTLAGLTDGSVAEFSQDGQTLVSSAGGVVQLWRVSDGVLLATMTGHEDSVDDVAISPDGQIIASISYNEGTLRAWRVENGEELYTLERRGFNAVFSPDGKMLAVQEVGAGPAITIMSTTDGATLATWPAWVASFDQQLQFSPDGKTLLSAGLGVPAQLWRVADGRLLTLLPTHHNGATLNLNHHVAVQSLIFSADGQTLGVCTESGPHLWNVTDGVPLPLAAGHDSYSDNLITSVAYSPDGQWVVSADPEEMRVWSAVDLTLVKTIPNVSPSIDLTFSPDGQILASTNTDGFISLYRTADWSLDRLIEAQENGVRVPLFKPTFSPDGHLLAAIGGFDGNVYLWRTGDATLQGTLMTEKVDEPVSSVVFSPDGQTLAVSLGNDIQLWRIADRILLDTLQGSTADIVALAFATDGATLASLTREQSLRLWQVSDGSTLWEVGTSPAEGFLDRLALAFTPNNQTLVVTSPDGRILTHRAIDGQQLTTWQASTEPIYDIALSPDGQTLVTGGEDSTLRLWRTSDGTLLESRLGLMTGGPCAFSPDLRTVAAGNGRWFFVQNVANGEILAAQDTKYEDTSWTSVVFSLNGQLLAVIPSGSSSVQLWQTINWTPTTVIDSHPEGTDRLAFSPDGETLATSSSEYDNGAIILSRVTDGERLGVLEGHTNTMSDMVFSPDGQTLISASYDDTVKIWRVADGTLMATLKLDDESSPSAVAISPDGALIATGGFPGNTLHLWRAADGVLLATLNGGYSGEMSALAFASDGKLLAAGAEDGTIMLWGVRE